MTDREAILSILKNNKTIAMVGLSNDPERPSFRVAKYLIDAGYRVIPVNPSVEEVLGQKSYPDLASIPDEVDVVDVFRRPEHVPEIAKAAIAKGARVLWLQEGVSHPEAEETARQAGLEVVSNDCMRREHRRLRKAGCL
ncbi:MAG: CoA-binding protein [Chloroflexota bacterium]